MRVLAQLVDKRTDTVVGNQITPFALRLNGKKQTASVPLEAVSFAMRRARNLTLQIVAQSSAYNTFPRAATCGTRRSRCRSRRSTSRVGQTPMTHEYSQTEQFRGARIHVSDLAGLEIRDCEVGGLKIVDCYGGRVYIGGEFDHLVVNDVDVTGYVEAELDRRHPVRVVAREATNVDDYRAAWEMIEELWEAAIAGAKRLPESLLHERVDGVVRSSDAAASALRQRRLARQRGSRGGVALPALEAFRRAQCPPMWWRNSGSRWTQLRPSTTCWNCACCAWHVCAGDDGTHRCRAVSCVRSQAGASYPDQQYVVGRCLKVVLREEAEHLRYALRDLAVLGCPTHQPGLRPWLMLVIGTELNQQIVHAREGVEVVKSSQL